MARLRIGRIALGQGHRGLGLALACVLLAAAPAAAAANVSGLPNASAVNLNGGGALRGQFRITSEAWTSVNLKLDGWVWDRKADSRKVCIKIDVSYAFQPLYEKGKTYCDSTSTSGSYAIPGQYTVSRRGGIAGTYGLDRVRIKIWTDGGPLRNDWDLTRTYTVSGA